MSDAASSASAAVYPGLSRGGTNGEARFQVLSQTPPEVTQPTSLVAYRSRGQLLIIGPGSSVRLAAGQASAELTVSLLITDSPAGEAAPRAEAGQAGPVRSIHAQVAGIHGHLGNFQVDVESDQGVRTLAPSILTANQPYDLILDLGRPAMIRNELLPPGYAAPDRDGEDIASALATLADLVGEFEKPRYFNYNPNVCAHGASGLDGCRRCLDACPAAAITSIGERIEVDAHLCQGGGACASTCPTGAIRYAYPVLPDLLARLGALIEAYRQAGGGAPVLLLHDEAAGREWILAHAPGLPENCLPFSLEEVASAGLEIWLSLIAFGAGGVALLGHTGIPQSVRALVREQVELAGVLLAGMGYPAERVVLLDSADSDACSATLAGFDSPLVTEPARYQAVDDKRTTVRQALDHLHARAPGPVDCIDLPAGAPFGEIRVDKASCTLCMSCASVCPAGAVLAGGELPQLRFVEQNCVQCGLCVRACPENSISLNPRMLYPLDARRRPRILNEDEPFHCLRCGRAFATTRTIEAIIGKLSGHWMYAGKPEQLQRLQMCDDCRVRDMFEQEGRALDVRKD